MASRIGRAETTICVERWVHGQTLPPNPLNPLLQRLTLENEMDEQAYEQGSRAAWSYMLGECLRHLGYNSPEARSLGWIKERESIAAMLRQVCDTHGDNDWLEDDHLGDVIEKHLINYLEQRPD